MRIAALAIWNDTHGKSPKGSALLMIAILKPGWKQSVLPWGG